MAFLEDIGRTNQLAVSSGNLINLSRQMRSDERADKLAEQQGATQAVNLEVAKIQLEKVKKEEAFNNQVMTIDQVFGSVPTLANSPTAQKHLLDLAGPALIDVNGVKGITRGDLGKIMQGIQTNGEFQKVLSEALLQDHVGIKNQLMQQLQDPKLKPEQAQQLKQQLAQNEQTISTMLTNRAQLDKDAAKREAEIKLLEAKTASERAQASLYTKRANEPSGGTSGIGGRAAEAQAYRQFISVPGNENVTFLDFHKQWKGKDETSTIEKQIEKLENARFNAVNKGKFSQNLLGQLGMKDESAATTPDGLDRYTKFIDTRIGILQKKLDTMEGLVDEPAPRAPSGAAPSTKASHPLTRDKAQEILREAGGDPRKAEQLARERGYRF